MKILYITSNKINNKTGGGIEANKIYESLKRIVTDNKNNTLRVISLDEKTKYNASVKINKSRIKDILSRFLLHSNFLYIEWPKIRKYILKFNPDVILIGNSRLGFIAKKIKKIRPKTKIIGHFDNIEFDYLKSYSLKYNKIFASGFRLLEGICVKKDEKQLIENMDLGIFLTDRDVKRAKELYIKSIDSKIIPICIEEFRGELKSKNHYDLNLVFLGSLWYGSNIDGIKWFLENVWIRLLEFEYNLNFIIGGSNPSDSFIEYLKQFENISLYPNFDKKEDIIPNNSVFVSPIQYGAGMKVKVADALSMNLRIIGSKESLIGYDEILKDNLNQNIVKLAQKPKDYINYIIEIINESFDEKNKKPQHLYNKYYSLNRAKKEFKSIFSDLINKSGSLE